MNNNDIANRLKDTVPEFATLLRSNHAPLAYFILATLLGTDATPDAICKVLDDDLAGVVEKLTSYDIKALMESLSEQQSLPESAQTSDVSSARDMQIAALYKGKGDFANWFAVLVFLSCFAMIGVMLLHGASTINDSMRFYVLGFLQSVVMAIVGFYFGSTAPTRKQHAALQEQAK